MKRKALQQQIGLVMAATAILGGHPATAVGAADEHVATNRIEEIIVTAEKRESSLQATPIAITALDNKALVDRGIADIVGVIKAIPSMSFTPYPTTATTLTLYMRGSGVQDAGQITYDTATGFYQDGFYISRPQLMTFDLADVERVEVLRGPQGTLYGRNTTGGAVNLISRKPSGNFGFKQEVEVGTKGRLRSLTVVDLPAVGNLNAKLSWLKREQDGYVRNPGPGHDFGLLDEQAGRIALRWAGDGPFTADYFFEQGDLDSTAYYYTSDALVGLLPGYSNSRRPEHRSYRPIDLPKGTGKTEGHGLTLEWQFSDALTLRSLTGYRELDTVAYQDYAETFFVGFKSTDDISTHQFSQELQALGTLLDGRIDYVAGLYYFNEKGSHYQNIIMTDALPGSDPLRLDKDRFVKMESKSKALFAQLTWTPPILDDRLALTFGGRYTKDNRKATRRLLTQYFGFPIAEEPAPGLRNTNDIDSSEFSPSFTANFAWNEHVSTYLRIATGYKAGGSSESTDVGQFGITFDPEKVTLYELGLKSYLFDRSVRLNAALFRTKYKDMQLTPNTNPNDLSVVLGMNAGKATIDGLELELLWQPLDALSITLDYTWLDAGYDRIPAPAGTIFDPAVNPSSPYYVGEDIKQLFVPPYAPENTINAGVNWTFLKFDRSELTAILNYRWEDRTYHSSGAGPGVPNHKLASRDPYGLWDGRISWQSDIGERSRLRVDLWGKNLTDRKWPMYVVTSGNQVTTEDVYGVITPAGMNPAPMVWAERRSYGVNVVYEY